MLPRSYFRLLILTAAVAALLGAPALQRTASATDLESAKVDLKELTDNIKSKRSFSDDIKQYLDQVFTNLKTLEGPPKPADDAPEEEKDAWKKENEKFQKDFEKYRKDAEKQFLKAFSLSVVKGETNIRDDVNIKAAVLLGDLGMLLDEKGKAALSKRLRAATEKLHKAKGYRPHTDHLDAAYASLGKMNVHSSLEWMAENYLHTNDVERDFLVSAHKAMVLFTDVPGPTRYAIAKEMIKTYASVEVQAEKSASDAATLAKKRFWDAIKTETIPCVQYFCGQPRDAEDRAYAKMVDLEKWFRKNKNARKAPWIDEKVSGGGK